MYANICNLYAVVAGGEGGEVFHLHTSCSKHVCMASCFDIDTNANDGNSIAVNIS